jgi:AAA+ ATPase superfamily predicted ATPase
MMIIERTEVDEIKKIKKWLLIYGRRKTGKTFLVETFLKFDEYFFVKRDRTILSKKDQKEITYETLTSLLERGLSNGNIIVIDEFHRLGDDFLDFIQYTNKKGKLILISSTLFLSKKMFTSKSPILGFFAEVPVQIIRLDDCLRTLRQYNLDKKRLLETAILLREPLAIEYFDAKENPRKTLVKILQYSTKAIPALVGEIFVEEERSISAVYEGILRAIANGNTVSGEISSYLFSRKTIQKDDPSLIQQYLKNLMEFGIIKRIKVYGNKRLVYKHISPLVRIFYYADEKYNISERRVTEGELERIVDEIMPLLVEDSIREFLAEKLGLEESVAQAKDFDVDGVFLRFKKPEALVEVKWRETIKTSDISDQLQKLKAKKSYLFVPDKRKIKGDIALGMEVVDILDFL